MAPFFKILALVFLAAVLSSVKRYEHLTRAFNRFSCGVWLAAQITMDSKDKKASWEGAVVSKDEFAEYEHGANESHGEGECRDANEDGAAAGEAAADVAAAAGKAAADAAAAAGKAAADVATADDAVAGANAGEGANESAAAAEDAKARRRAHRAAIRAQRRQRGAFGQQSSEWGGLPYSDALLQKGLEHARVIAEKRISGAPRAAEDWLDNNAEVNLALLAKAGRLARECLIEAHLDAVYAATKGYKRLFEAHDLGAEYHRAVRLAVEDSIDKFNLSEGHVLNSWVSTNKKPVERRLCECYAQKTALRSEHEARKYFAIIKAYRKLEDSLQGARRPTEDELLEALAEHTATRGLSREAMLDILNRGSDGVHRVTFSAAPPCGRGAAPAAARASVVPAAKLAAGAMDVASVVGTINGTEDADVAGFADAERARRASGAETAAVEGCVADSEGAAGSVSMGGEPVVHDSDALIFRNGIEQDMTPLERAVYKARIAPIVDADARLRRRPRKFVFRAGCR